MANEAGNIGSGAMTGAGLGTMIMPGIGTAIGVGAGGLMGLVKSIIDGDNEKKDRLMQATTTRYSPWTGLRAREVAHSDPLGTMVASLAGGAQMGQGLQKSAADNELTKAIAARLSKGPAQTGQQQGPAPIITQEEAGKADAPTASMGDSLGGDGNLDQIMKLLRLAKGGRGQYGTIG